MEYELSGTNGSFCFNINSVADDRQNERIYQTTFLVFAYVLPLAIICLLYGSLVCRLLRGTGCTGNNHSGPVRRGGPAINGDSVSAIVSAGLEPPGLLSPSPSGLLPVPAPSPSSIVPDNPSELLATVESLAQRRPPQIGNATSVRATEAMRARRRVTRMVIVVVAVFAACWLPYHVVTILQAFADRSSYVVNSLAFAALKIASNCIAYLNSCLNPLLYAFLSDNFRSGFVQTFGGGRRRRRSCYCCKSATTADDRGTDGWGRRRKRGSAGGTPRRRRRPGGTRRGQAGRGVAAAETDRTAGATGGWFRMVRRTERRLTEELEDDHHGGTGAEVCGRATSLTLATRSRMGGSFDCSTTVATLARDHHQCVTGTSNNATATSATTAVAATTSSPSTLRLPMLQNIASSSSLQ